MSEANPARPRWRWGMTLFGIAAVLAVAFGAYHLRTGPRRCPSGMIELCARCCGDGQKLEHGACAGSPRSCSDLQAPSGYAGCVAIPRQVSFAGGELALGGDDWEEAAEAPIRRIHVGPFRLDMHEVTLARFAECSRSGRCRGRSGEAGLPVVRVSAGEAEAFCAFAGGRLPSAEEWLWAAKGDGGRRYPWGATGLVCRRAAFGLLDGPCATGGGPELAGSRPDGSSPEGVADLAGNVAEWTREASGYRARGGSFASLAASDLKGLAVEPAHERAANIGFRCAYGP